MLAALFMFLYLGFAFVRPLANPDEGRYTEIPREMAQSGDWVTPRLNGVEYFYKPPLFYWAQAASIKAFGVNRVSARLPNAIFASLGVLLTYVAGRLLYGSRRTGLIAAFLLGTCGLYLGMAHIVTMDMPLAVFLSGALFAFILAYRQKQNVARGVWILIFFAFAALALLSKGFMAVLIPAAVIFLFAFVAGPWRFLKHFAPSDLLWTALGILIFFAITAPWHILAALANPAGGGVEFFTASHDGQGFLWYYVVHEHFLRYIDPATSQRAQPFYFFFIVAPLGFLPWAFALPQAFKSAFAGGFNNARANNPQGLFLTIWAIFIVLFFSVSSSKLIPYVLPIFPALAVITASWISKVWKANRAQEIRTAVKILGGFAVLAGICAVPVYMILEAKGRVQLEDASYGIAVFAVLSVALLIGGIFALRDIRGNKPKGALLSIFIAWCVFAATFDFVGALFQRPDSQEFAKVIKGQMSAGDAVLLMDYGNSQDMPVWLGSPVYVWGVPEEQSFGFKREEAMHTHRYIESQAELKALLASGKRVFIVMRNKDIEKYDKLFGAERLKKLDANKRMSLFSNQ